MLKLNETVFVGPTETKILTKIHLVYSAKTAQILWANKPYTFSATRQN